MGSTQRILARAGACAVVFSVAGLSMGQPANRPGRPPEGQPPLLRGPAVQETGIPGTQRAFSMEGMEGPQARTLDREIPMGEFLGALRALSAPETPTELHLTPPQRDQLGAIAQEHAMAVREYMSAHREELASLAAVLGFEPGELQRGEQAFTQRLAEGERRARRAIDAAPESTPSRADEATPPGTPRRARRAAQGAPPEVPAAQGQGTPSPEQIIRERVGDNPTPAQRDAMARLREIRAGAPSALESQTRAWNTLHPPQQQFVQARLDESRQRMQAQRGEMYVQEMARQIEGESGRLPQAPPGAAAGSPGERLHRLIDTLSPQEQEMLLRLLQTRLPELRERAGQGLGQPGAPGRRPPPPPMDQINVPPADPV